VSTIPTHGEGGGSRGDPSDPPVDLSVIVPTFREADNIRPLTERVFRAARDAGLAVELIIVDDDSRDGTTELCAELSRSHNVVLLSRHGERGLATAVLLGFRNAKGRFLLAMDADLSHPPEAIPDVMRALREGADFVLGSRYVAGAGVEEGWGLLRWANSKVATLLARPLVRVSDPLSGYFALSRADFRRARDLSPLGYKIGLELLVKIAPTHVVEIPIQFKDRAAGRSKLSARVQLQYLRHLCRLYRYRARWFRGPSG
jgi:dolichol-phosphate mannosyltransferase